MSLGTGDESLGLPPQMHSAPNTARTDLDGYSPSHESLRIEGIEVEPTDTLARTKSAPRMKTRVGTAPLL